MAPLRHLKRLPVAHASQYRTRMLLQRAHADSLHVRQCSTSEAWLKSAMHRCRAEGKGERGKVKAGREEPFAWRTRLKAAAGK